MLLLNKCDLKAHVSFDLEGFRGDVRRLNGAVELLEVSARTGEGLDKWLAWLRKGRTEKAAGA